MEYDLTEDDTLLPTITSIDVTQGGFPVPCNCLKCAKKTFSLSCGTNKLL